ncbi:MAG: hypothetical protein R6U91_00530 [Bacillota bacterium]
MKNKVTAVIFEGSLPKSPVEEAIVLVRQAALLDNLGKMNNVPLLDRILLYTNRSELVEPAKKLGAEVFLNSKFPDDFHFGHELQTAIRKNNLNRVLCLNGAGSPLITVDELNMVCDKLMNRERFVYTNNTQSVDIIAFTVPNNLYEVELPATDNSLAMALRDQLGLNMELMPHTLGLMFDIDTPTDLLVLGGSHFAGPRTKDALAGLQLDLDYNTLKQAKAVLSAEYEDVALIGRVGAPVIERLNALLKLRLRVFSEERGMKSLGRIEANEVVSLLGLLIDHAGLENFFNYLSRVASCAFIDTRVLMHHYFYDFSDEERFLSDLGMWKELENPWLKEFTRLAVHCPIPVILGGHSLVSGSLWALSTELAPEA